MLKFGYSNNNEEEWTISNIHIVYQQAQPLWNENLGRVLCLVEWDQILSILK